MQANHKSVNHSINLLTTLVVTKEPFSKPQHVKRLAFVICLNIKKRVENQTLILYINDINNKTYLI